MTEEEKELEEKIKQYQYEHEERTKNMEKLYKDTHSKKKTVIYVMNKILGIIAYGYMALFTLFLVYLIVYALTNYINNLNAFDPVKAVECTYDIKLETISREVEETTLIYKVKPKKGKYKDIEFTIIKEGMGAVYNDFGDRYLKYVAENLVRKDIIENFEAIEEYQEHDLFRYKLIYKLDEQNSEIKKQKVQELINYIISIDNKNMRIISNINQMVISEEQLLPN